MSCDEIIENLEVLKDDLAGAGDTGNADLLAKVINAFEDMKQLNIPKKVINEGDHYRCSSCGTSLGYKNGRCYECGQRLLG